MILRNIAIRHGRTALAAPLQRCSRRSMTTIEEVESSIENVQNHIRKAVRTLQKEHGIEESLTPGLKKVLAEDNEQKKLRAAQKYESTLAELRQRHGNIPTDQLVDLERRRLLKERKKKLEEQKALQAKQAIRRDNKIYNLNQKNLGKLGSVVAPAYVPDELLANPPEPKDITLELLLASQTHMGHATSLWNPANQRYITGVRQGIHIISLEATAAHLRRAAKVVEGVAYHGGLILFVGTRDNQDQAVVTAAKNAKGCHLFERWIPGTLTNGDDILRLSHKCAVDELDQRIQSPTFEANLADHKALKPDLVVVLNPLENYICLRECSQNNIPTIGVIDTDADPTWVTYVIPANDDSLRSTNLIAGVLGRAGQAGQAKRLEAAKTGNVTWTTQHTLKEWAKEDAVWMERYKEETQVKMTT